MKWDKLSKDLEQWSQYPPRSSSSSHLHVDSLSLGSIFKDVIMWSCNSRGSWIQDHEQAEVSGWRDPPLGALQDYLDFFFTFLEFWNWRIWKRSRGGYYFVILRPPESYLVWLYRNRRGCVMRSSSDPNSDKEGKHWGSDGFMVNSNEYQEHLSSLSPMLISKYRFYHIFEHEDKTIISLIRFAKCNREQKKIPFVLIYVNFVKILTIVAMVTMLGWPGAHALLRRVLTKRHF